MKYLVFDAEDYPRWFETEEDAIAFARNLSIENLTKGWSDPVGVFKSEVIAFVSSSVETTIKREG